MTDDLIWHIATQTIPAAFSLLPGRMASDTARAQILAAGLQESGFLHRRQVGGPARSFWQFEQVGVGGVLELAAPIITPICDELLYPATSAACYAALEHNDVLAVCFARLLLWLDPRALPGPSEADKGWAIYLAGWRPGKPRPETWPTHFSHAWRVVDEAIAAGA